MLLLGYYKERNIKNERGINCLRYWLQTCENVGKQSELTFY